MAIAGGQLKKVGLPLNAAAAEQAADRAESLPAPAGKRTLEYHGCKGKSNRFGKDFVFMHEAR